ncbi:MAG: hypothetical protein K2X66_05440 [Cyanobacteria bacterium]|nr:hypothetical protein [Cyanobacteriota bacterium]
MGLSASSPLSIFGPLIPNSNNRNGTNNNNLQNSQDTNNNNAFVPQQNNAIPNEDSFTPQDSNNNSSDNSNIFDNAFFGRPSKIFPGNDKPKISPLPIGGAGKAQKSSQ